MPLREGDEEDRTHPDRWKDTGRDRILTASVGSLRLVPSMARLNENSPIFARRAELFSEVALECLKPRTIKSGRQDRHPTSTSATKIPP